MGRHGTSSLLYPQQKDVPNRGMSPTEGWPQRQPALISGQGTLLPAGGRKEKGLSQAKMTGPSTWEDFERKRIFKAQSTS